ncbi:MAG: EamA family transporter [Chloroflexota bacterium]
MPLLAILLLFVSAAMHTTWNLLLKQSEDKFPATWWISVVGGVLSLIALLFVGLPPRQVWLLALLSAFLEAVYFLLLTTAYSSQDFSLAYPVARGAAPGLLAVWSVLFLGEKPSLAGALGLGMIVGGLMILGATSLLQNRVGKIRATGLLAALATALVISFYTVVDGTAVRLSPALLYGLFIFTFTPVFVSPFVLRNYGWTRLANAWRGHSRRFLVIGTIATVAYLIALVAYSFAPLSYSGAIREVSVVMGAFAGWKFLGEKMGGLRIFGAAVIFAGILVIVVFG